MDIENSCEKRKIYFEKMQSLKSILQDFIPEIIYCQNYFLDNGKEIARIYVEKQNVCIHNKNTWQETMEFLNQNMLMFEDFWTEYQDFIKEDF